MPSALDVENVKRSCLDPIVFGEKWVRGGPTCSLDNINKFMGLTVANRLLALGVYPNAKEISEAMSMWKVLEKENFFGLSRETSKVLVVCVGDGTTPRLGALAALCSSWDVISVDPRSDYTWLNPGVIPRLECVRKAIENFSPLHDSPMTDLKRYEAVLILACHAHVEPRDMLASVTHPVRHLVCMPCCVNQQVFVNSGWDGFLEEVWPSSQYIDYGNWSPKRLVKVWRNV